jgi:hypothetical protein
MECSKQPFYGTRHLEKDLETIGFISNPYEPCMANKKVQGSQQTILFHVDNLKSSHKTELVNNIFEKCG